MIHYTLPDGREVEGEEFTSVTALAASYFDGELTEDDLEFARSAGEQHLREVAALRDMRLAARFDRGRLVEPEQAAREGLPVPAGCGALILRAYGFPSWLTAPVTPDDDPGPRPSLWLRLRAWWSRMDTMNRHMRGLR